MIEQEIKSATDAVLAGQGETAISETETSDAKQRVLDVAEALFMRQGYSAITLRDIADELGMRQASLYYHFPKGKEQLYIEMAERAFHRHRQGMEAGIAAAEPHVAAQLTAVAAWSASQPPMNLSSMMHADMPALTPEAAAHVRRLAYTCMYAPLRSIFVDSHSRGETRAVNPDVIAGAFLAILDSAHFSGQGPEVPSRRSMLDDVITMMLDGLRVGGESFG